MLEILKFLFSDAPHFVGGLLYLSVCAFGLHGLFRMSIHCGRRTKNNNFAPTPKDDK